MKIEPGKYYRTRDGRKARIYAIAYGGDYPVHGAVCDAKNVAWSLATWTNEGRFCAAGGRESGLDLVAEWVESTDAPRKPKLVVESGKYYRTRGGRKARVYDPECGGSHPVHGAVWSEEIEAWGFASWTSEGRFMAADREAGLDLVAEWREPVKVELWVNVYEWGFQTCESKAEADLGARRDRIACVYVSGVEGVE